MKLLYTLKNTLKNAGLLALFCMLVAGTARLDAQPLVIQEEGFESVSIFPSPGWRQLKATTNVSGAFVAQTFAGSTFPTVGAPPGGLLRGMMLNAFTAVLNDTTYIISKPFDFSNNGGTNPQMSFYMYRDNGFALADDHIRVYINTSPSRTGATLLSNTLGFNKMSRYFATAPAATANTWNQYTYDLPAATYNGRRYYFIIEGVCRDGNNLYMDRFAVNTYPSATNPGDVSLNLFFQNSASVGTGIDRHMVVGVRCIVGGTSGCGNISLGTALKLDSLLFNTNGTTNVLDIDDAKVYYTGGSNLYDTTYVSPFPATAGTEDYPSRRYGQTIAVPGTNLDFVNGAASCFVLEYDTTYFWLAYDVKPTATGGNFVDADFRGAAVGGTPGACPSPGGTGVPVIPGPGGFSISGASQIDLPYCVGTYTVGTSWLGGSYTNNDYIQGVILNGALGTAINTNVQGGMPASQPSNNNFGLPSNLPCLLANGGPGCDFTAQPPSYELWPAVTGRTVVLTQGASYTLTAQAGTWFSSNNIAAWIDYNRNGVFDDPSERLGGAGFQLNLLANGSGNINFTVPAAGYTGVTRMRVREVFASSNIQPCVQYTFGEIEDFQIIISPNCPVGYKLWLGNTDDWNNPGNWCGGVPTITDDAVLDRVQVFPPTGTPTRRYFPATIKSNIPANCNNLTISANDSVIINAPVPAANALKVRRDLTNNGRIEVISSLPAATKVTYSNGTLVNNIYTPFKSQSTDARTQIIYTAAELTLAGLIGGDRITAIEFTLNNKGSASPFNGFTISYALVPFTDHPAPPNPTPFAGPFTNAFGPTAFSTVFPGVNTINLTTPITWDGTSNLLIQMCYDNASNTGATDDRINITQTTGRRSTLIYSTTTNAASGCALSFGAGVTDNFYSALSSFRPNFTFVLNRPYGKAIINVQEDWINNNTFVAGFSQVNMDSTVAQTIGGTQNTTFNELRINKAAASQTVTMLRPVLIDSSLILAQGQMLMNTNTLTMNNPAVSGGTILAPTGPFTRTNGFLISESATASVIWKNITTNGWRNIPFGTLAASPVYIPYSVTLKSGGALGDFGVSTYYAPANLPLPPTVTHINSTLGANNAGATADRYWIVSKTGATPVVDLTFRFSNAAPSERPTGISGLNPGRAQPWWVNLQNRAWVRLTNPSTTTNYHATMQYGISGTFDSVRVVNWDWPNLPPQAFQASPPLNATLGGPIGNSNPWAISVNNTPLPVELLDFKAELGEKRVRLSWSTASEVNNDYFTVERTNKDMQEYTVINRVPSYMHNSNILLNYETWDDQPIQGLSYYRLKQTDFDGQFTYSDHEPILIGEAKQFEITNVYGHTSADGQFMVEFLYDSEMPLDMLITDASGRVVFKENNIMATPGVNRVNISQSLSRGIYFVVLQNQNGLVNRRFMY
jgi:hypothetical protein